MRQQRLTPYLLIAPAVLFFAIYVLYPIVHTCVLSAYSWSTVNPARVYVGLDNYRNLLQDPYFLLSLKNNLLFVVLSIIGQLPVALLLALLIGSATRTHQFLRTLVFGPFVVPVVAVGLVWTMIYNPSFGALNAILARIDPSFEGRGWLSDPPWLAIYSIIFVSCWRYVGFHMMVLLAGLQAIPDELYEAAKIDGAGNWQAFRGVTLPLMRRVIAMDALLITVGSVKIFDLNWVMTQGGPNHASEVLATYMYTCGFSDDRMGYAAAIATVMLAITFVATVVYVRVSGKEEVGEL
ncbi:MAG: sugar ABC transporter permease [Armatimonadetes bacterium]|nr:sugar ABC transporter permease [Armatimonadota bacterium]